MFVISFTASYIKNRSTGSELAIYNKHGYQIENTSYIATTVHVHITYKCV